MIQEGILAIAMTVQGVSVVPHVKDKECTCREDGIFIQTRMQNCFVDKFPPHPSFRMVMLVNEDGEPKVGRVVVRCNEPIGLQ